MNTDANMPTLKVIVCLVDGRLHSSHDILVTEISVSEVHRLLYTTFLITPTKESIVLNMKGIAECAT